MVRKLPRLTIHVNKQTHRPSRNALALPRKYRIATVGEMMMIWLAFGFAITAALYASVGFGGGSTYTALLTLAGTDYRILPAISLLCNIIVVTGGTIRYAKAGEVPWRRVLPIIAISAPLATLGGLTPIRQPVFLTVLGLSLLVSGLLLLLQRDAVRKPRFASPVFHLIAGGAFGYLAGLVGIGGGIFLAPLLHLTGWGQPRAIAATASVFILVNSLAGMAGQSTKLMATGEAAAIISYWPLIFAVLVGGQIGSHLGLKLFSEIVLRRATGALVLFVAAQLLWRQF
jgi:uncharacterized protein